MAELENRRAPNGLSPRARKFWHAATEAFDFAMDEAELLREVVDTMSVVDQLRDLLAETGLMVAAEGGSVKANPALAELRQQRAALTRMLKALSLPEEGDDGEDAEPDKTPAERMRSERARHAAARKWKKYEAAKNA